VKVSRHPFFSRRGRDIVCRVPVSEKVAKSGTTLHVRTLRGRRHEVVVPPDTSDGTIVRLEGEGIESEGQRGDQLIEIRVKGSLRKKTGGLQ
jgi:molecular chaperone DnaJ